MASSVLSTQAATTSSAITAAIESLPGPSHRVPIPSTPVSKVFGEALGRMYADKYGLSVVSLRIGTCCASPLNRRTLSTWLSFRDLVQLVRICVEAFDVHYETVWGVSGNTRGWWDNRAAGRLGYRPADNAEDYVEQAIEAERQSRAAGQPGAGVLPGPEPDAERLFQGGSFCAAGIRGRPGQDRLSALSIFRRRDHAEGI